MTRLLVISSAPAAIIDGQTYLDKKFVEGMRYYSKEWSGPVSCILKKQDEKFPFSQQYDLQDLPFGVNIITEDRDIESTDVAGYDIVVASGDNHKYLHVSEICNILNIKSSYIIEYIVETRSQIIFIDRYKSIFKKIYSFLWMLSQERRRRRAFRVADGIQANGYPAMSAYGPMNKNTVMYLDNRIRGDLLATSAEMEAKCRRLMAGERLRIIHSGRLEPMKGSQDLIPFARRLAQRGVDFQLDIFGAGSLEPEIRKGIAEHGLADRVILNGVVDFETELVPFARANADIYLSCHRQSDPSCTYLESMGCGLAVAGYANRMWSALCHESHAGWAVPLGRADKLADAVADAAGDRRRLVDCCDAARSFAGAHSFEDEFKRRMDHLKSVAGLAG